MAAARVGNAFLLFRSAAAPTSVVGVAFPDPVLNALGARGRGSWTAILDRTSWHSPRPFTAGARPSAGLARAAKTSNKVTFCKTEDLAIDATHAASFGGVTRMLVGVARLSPVVSTVVGEVEDRGIAGLEDGDARLGRAALDGVRGVVGVLDAGEAGGRAGGRSPVDQTHTVSLTWPAAAGQIKGAYTDVQVYPTHTTK